MSLWKAGLLALVIPAALSVPALAQEAGGPGRHLVFDEIDADGDGAVTLDELRAAGPRRMAAADTDGDGLLTRAELLAQAMPRVEAGIDRLIARADADGDGMVSLAEAEALREGGRGGGRVRGNGWGRGGPDLERIFGRLDADDDGAVTRAEWEAGMARLIERMGERHGGRGRD